MILKSVQRWAASLVSAAALTTGMALAQAAPSPSPAPTATSVPFIQWGGALSGATFGSSPANATGALDTANGADRSARTDLSNALVNVTVNSGLFRAAATAGFYSFPIVGAAINPIDQAGANTTVFSPLPFYSVSYDPNAHLTFSAGKLLTQLGQESPFTYQNFNIDRGFGWAMEPLISHGVRGSYTNGPWTLALEANDGYYGGSSRAFEGSLAFAPTATQTFSVAVILPKADTSANPTAPVANKREEDFMYAGTFGKLTLTPYLLFVQSPAAATLGYANEGAWVGSLLGTYDLSSAFSLGFRFEDAQNSSVTTDAFANADLIGYGPGSGATSITLTPTYKTGPFFLRVEWAHASVNNLSPGLGFGAQGAGTSQDRYALEAGITH